MNRDHRLHHLLACCLSMLATLAARASDCEDLRIRICPDIDGHVVVDSRYDVDGTATAGQPSVLSRAEIQCAIDCIDGEPAPDHSVPSGVTTLPSGDPSIWIGTFGGLIELVPGAHYKLEGGGLRLPLMATGKVTFDGRGATIEMVPPQEPLASFVALSHRVPATANNMDVEEMGTMNDGWTVANTRFRFPAEMTATPGRIVGIELDGLKHASVRNCSFEGSYDEGVTMRFSLLSSVEGCRFEGSRAHDVGVLDRFDCTVDGTTECWLAASPPRLFTGPPGATQPSGCNGMEVSHVAHLAASSGSRGVLAANSDDVTIEQDSYRGARTVPAIDVAGGFWVNDFLVRDAHFVTTGAIDRPLVRAGWSGAIYHDNLTVETTDGQPNLVQSVDVGIMDASFRNMSRWSDELRLKLQSRYGSYFGFTNVGAARSLGDPCFWLDTAGTSCACDGSTGTCPDNAPLVFSAESPESLILPVLDVGYPQPFSWGSWWSTLYLPTEVRACISDDCSDPVTTHKTVDASP